jgi:hypothetical protein
MNVGVKVRVLVEIKDNQGTESEKYSNKNFRTTKTVVYK